MAIARHRRDGKSPRELRTGRRANINSRRVWGCRVAARIPPPWREGKLDQQNVDGINLGRCRTKPGYWVWSPDTGIYATSNVTFFENEFPFKDGRFTWPIENVVARPAGITTGDISLATGGADAPAGGDEPTDNDDSESDARGDGDQHDDSDAPGDGDRHDDSDALGDGDLPNDSDAGEAPNDQPDGDDASEAGPIHPAAETEEDSSVISSEDDGITQRLTAAMVMRLYPSLPSVTWTNNSTRWTCSRAWPRRPSMVRQSRHRGTG